MSQLVTSPSLKEFFKSLLEEAIQRRQVALGQTTEFYLVNLLADFASSDKLFAKGDDGRSEQEPLALLYHRALQGPRDERIRTLRRLGDVSLYQAGFFSGALRESPVGQDYYVQMGGAAYGQLADLAPGAGFGAVYRELSARFRALVDLLEEIAARGLVRNGASGALKVYESWVRTGNDRLQQVLVDAGMVPTKGLAN